MDTPAATDPQPAGTSAMGSNSARQKVDATTKPGDWLLCCRDSGDEVWTIYPRGLLSQPGEYIGPYKEKGLCPSCRTSAGQSLCSVAKGSKTHLKEVGIKCTKKAEITTVVIDSSSALEICPICQCIMGPGKCVVANNATA